MNMQSTLPNPPLPRARDPTQPLDWLLLTQHIPVLRISPALTAECHQVFVTALIALDPHKSMSQSSAAQVRIKFLTHEFWQHSITLTKMREERIGVLLDNPVEQRFLWPVSYIVAVRRYDGANTVRLRMRLDGVHPSNCSASMSPAQWSTGTSR